MLVAVDRFLDFPNTDETMHVQWCCIEFIYLRELLSILIKYTTRVTPNKDNLLIIAKQRVFGVTYFIYMSYDNTHVYCVFAAAFSNAYDFVNLKFFSSIFFWCDRSFSNDKKATDYV